MDYGAITIDTSIFDEKGLKFESGILKTLEQFEGKPSRLILSEIIIREVHSHLMKKAKESRAQIIKAIRESTDSLSISQENATHAAEVLIPKEDDKEVAKKRIALFIKNTGAEIIPASGRVELNEVVKRYFNNEPPFAESGKKKSEFPDAIALMSLESWAKENSTKVLAVAKDNDWAAFAQESEYIDVIDDLAQGIAQFQPHSAAVDFCKMVATKLPSGEPENIYQSIHQYLSDSVSEMDVDPEASSQFFYEPDYVEVVLDEFNFVEDSNGNAVLQPVQGQNKTLIVEAKVNVKATASTSFSLSIRDSVDKDYVPVGDASVSASIEFEAELLLIFEGSFDDEIADIELTGFELLSYPRSIDFGEIEPDFWHEDG